MAVRQVRTPPMPVAPDSLVHSAFYKFAQLDDPDHVVTVLRELVAPLTGSVLVAHEGINGVLAGLPTAMSAFEHALAQDPRLGGAFKDITFKHSACRTKPFWKVKVHRKAEIVALGFGDGSSAPPLDDAHTHVAPEQWRALIERDDVVVLDNRNSFEYRLGHFKPALNPLVDNFRDFPAYVQAHAPQWKAQGKRVAMYCTGGIRCEKTSAWMQQDLGLEVYQLDGGVLNYFQTMPDADRDWVGECFVFDNRIALDTRLQETGTTAEQVYNDDPDEQWRLERARRLDSTG